MADKKEKQCFVIAPIGEDNSDTRKRSNQILKHIIEPVTLQLGYTTTRADKLSKPGIITSQIINHLLEDDLVIADLTEKNPNVFYELAIRHAIRKPVVQIIFHTETLPFDISASRTIKFDHKDLDSVAICKEELEKQIKAVEKDASLVDSPISNAIDIKSLSSSSDPLAKSNAEILNMLQDMKGEMSSIHLSLLQTKLSSITAKDLVNNNLNQRSYLVEKDWEKEFINMNKEIEYNQKEVEKLINSWRQNSNPDKKTKDK